LLEAEAVLRAARNSLVVATGSSLAATGLGASLAVLLTRYRFPGKSLLLLLAVLPLLVPFVVLGVALLILFRAAGLNLSLWTVGIGHTIVALPYTLLILTARLAGFDSSLEEAAMDLGASYATMLRRIVLPLISPALLSAWLTAFTVSFDEFALALFLAGTEPTFPVYLFSQLRFASRLPVMIAMAVLLMVGTLTLALAADRLRRLD
jgi:spermidine/putrescine transport system permease protein